MGVCQSTLCPLDEDSVLKSDQNQKISQRPAAVKIQLSKDHDNAILSPTLTEATTPASEAVSWTPINGPMSLASLISSGGTFSHEATPALSGSAWQTQSSIFNFMTDDLASTIAEEEEADAPSDEDEATDQTNQEKTGADLILNPPLLAPSPNEVNILLNSKTRQDSGNGRMLHQFQRLKLQAQMVARKEKTRKKQAKIKSRVEEMKENQELFDEFQHIQLLHDTANKDRRNEGQREASRGQLPPRSNSFDLHNTTSWYINFRKSLHVNQDIQDDASCHSGLSLLSKESMEAQRKLYAEKRRQREIRYSARRKKAPKDAAGANSANPYSSQSSTTVSTKVHSKSSRDYETYFQDLLKETEVQLMSTPMISPPRLHIVTNESKVTLGTHDYGPPVDSIKPGLSREPSVTNMEVEIPSGEKKPLGDDTTCSGITDADFESDFRLQRRRRYQPGPKREDASMASSMISYGGLTSYGRSIDNKENIRPVGCHQNGAGGESEKLTAFVHEALNARESDRMHHVNRDESSLKNRIVDLEKKMGIAPPQNATYVATSDCDQFPSVEKQNAKETMRVIGIVPEQARKALINSPISTPADLKTSTALARNVSTQEHSPALEPMQLQKMFDENETPYTDVREQIVMGNCNFTRESIAFMTTEDFRRISTDHALVRWNKDKGSFVLSQSSTDDEQHGQNEITAVTDTRQDESFANDIADEVNNVLSRYKHRNWSDDAEILDANELFDADKSFASVQGKLYLA